MVDKLLKEQILRMKILSDYSLKKTYSENVNNILKEQGDFKPPMKSPEENPNKSVFYDPNSPKYYNLTVSEEYILQNYDFYIDRAKNMIKDLGDSNPKLTYELKTAIDDLKNHLKSKNKNTLTEDEFKQYYSTFISLRDSLSDKTTEIRKLYPKHELTYLERLAEKDPEIMKHGYYRTLKVPNGRPNDHTRSEDIDFGPWGEKNGKLYLYYLDEKGNPIRELYEKEYGSLNYKNASWAYPKTITRILHHDDYYLMTGDFEPNSLEEEYYLSQCSEPQRAITPPKDKKTGLSGMDLVRAVNGYEENDITGRPMQWCAYTYKKNQWIWIPNNSEIQFWDIESVSEWAKKWVKNRTEWGKKKYGENPKWNEWDEKEVIYDLTLEINFGSVRAVLVGGKWYNSVFRWDTGGPLTSDRVWDEIVQAKHLEYVGLYENIFEAKKVNKEARPLPEPKWEDPRNPVEKFLDDFGLAIQIGASIVLLFASIIAEFGPGTQPIGLILAEIAIETLIGVPLAIRSFQKGDNVGGAMSALLSLTSWLKLGNMIKGFKGSDLRSLAKKLATSGLKSESDDLSKWVLFYNGLNKEEQTAFKYFFMNPDGMTQRRIRAALFELKDTVLSESTMIKKVGKLLGESGEIKSIPFIKSFTAKEIGLQGALLGIGLATSAFFGEDLNNEQKKWAEDIHGTIPNELKEKWTQNMMFNAQGVQENLKDFKENLVPQEQLQMGVNDIITYYNTEIEYTVTKNNGTVVKDENLNAGIKEKQNLTKEDVTKMINEGWLTREDPKWRDFLLKGKKIQEVVYTYLEEPNNKLYKFTK